MNYRPPPDPRNRPNLLPQPKKRHPIANFFIVSFQLAGLFLIVRIVMLEQGMALVRIPFIDKGLRWCLSELKFYLSVWGLI